MYFGVSNGRYKSSQLPGWGWGPLPSPLTALSKMPPELSIYGLFLLGKVQGGWGGGGQRAEVLKSSFPKIPSTQSLSKEKSSHCLQIFPRQPLLCPSREGEWRGGRKRMRWEKGEEVTKEGIKRGWVLRSSFGVPLVCRERSPQGPGLGLGSSQAQNRSCGSLEMGARRKVQLALPGWALPPGCK